MRLSELLPAITPERPVQHGRLTMIPLRSEALLRVEPLCLEQALDRRAVELRERRDQAQVNSIEAMHRGRRPVLLLAGEELVGALQNRILNTSAWLAGGCRALLPVSCVEQGRWSPAGGTRFASGRSMYLPTSRSSHVREVTESYRTHRQAAADQGRVWSDVSERLRSHGVRSATQRMHDLYDTRDLDAYETALHPTAGQCGFAFLAGSRFLGLELFGTPGFCARVFGMYLRSYALETVRMPSGPALGEGRAARGVERVLRHLRAMDGASYDAPGGAARDLRFRTDRLHGSALHVPDLGLVHLGAFAA